MPSAVDGISERGNRVPLHERAAQEELWLEGACPVCHQPECPESTGGQRPPGGGGLAFRPKPGQRSYRGYGEWVVHPDEARFILHRGYAVVNGERKRVWFIHNEAYCTQIKVEGTFAGERPSDSFVDAAHTRAA